MSDKQLPEQLVKQMHDCLSKWPAENMWVLSNECATIAVKYHVDQLNELASNCKRTDQNTEPMQLQIGDWFTGTEEQYRKVLALSIDPKIMVPSYPKTCETIGFLAYNGYGLFCLGPIRNKLSYEEFINRAENTFTK